MRPTDEMVRQAYEANSDGAGIAWRSEDEHGAPVVKWEKGLQLERMREMVQEVDLPLVAHFRIASVGPAIRLLTHPFNIGEDAGLHLQGSTAGQVVFHNGTWSTWRSSMHEAILKSHLKVPAGKWSDSRAMAFLAHHFGPGYLEFLGMDEKVVLFGPTDDETEILSNRDWTVVEGVLCSNDFFTRRRTREVNWSRVADSTTPIGPVEESTGRRITPPLIEVTDSTSDKTNQGTTGGSPTESPFPNKIETWRDIQTPHHAIMLRESGLCSRKQFNKAMNRFTRINDKKWVETQKEMRKRAAEDLKQMDNLQVVTH